MALGPIVPAGGGRALAWRQVMPALLVLLAALLFIYRDTAIAMVGIWERSETFAHAYLVPFIVLWLIWRRRESLSALQPQASPWILLPMLAVGSAWLLADLASVNALAQFSLVTLLVLAVPLLLGTRVARAIAFPLGFSFFAVPFGEFLLPYLIGWTADFTVGALRLSGIPVFREGTQFVIPSGQWSVVEACSGVRYLIASLMVGTLYAYLNYQSPRRRLAFIGISIAVPIVANWIRAYLIVMLGHLSSNQLATGTDHLIYGWLFFGIVIGALYAIGAIWREPEAALTAPLQNVGHHQADARRRPAAAWALTAAAVALALLPHGVTHLMSPQATAAPVSLSKLGHLGKGWELRPGSLTDWQPAFPNPSTQIHDTYVAGGREVGVYLGYYRAQDYEKKLVSSSNELVKSTDLAWALVAGPAPLTVVGLPEPLSVSAALLRSHVGQGAEPKRLAVWKFYWVGDRLTASDGLAKVYGAFDRLRGQGDDCAVILVYAAERAPGEANAVLESFVRDQLDAIVAHLRKTRRGLDANVATVEPGVTRSR
ncbi:MAG: exosortase A [Caldimonas sp.]